MKLDDLVYLNCLIPDKLSGCKGEIMKIRAVDIARELNLSKATVSLALNNKPGVSSKTRQAVFACMDRLSAAPVVGNSTVKIILVSKKLNIICDPVLDLWSEVLNVFKKELGKLNYNMSLIYINLFQDDIAAAVSECNEPDVVGVILYSTEINEYDFRAFQGIEKPLVVFDNSFGDDYHSVAIDNSRALQRVVDHLAERGFRRIQYLAQNAKIYNFLERRAGFQAGIRRNHLPWDEESIIPVGTTVESVCDYMKQHLSGYRLPEVYIMENYQVSLGVIQALSETGIRVPNEVSLFGVDSLPEVPPDTCQLRTVTIEHAEKALAAVMLLQMEIENRLPVKLHIFLKCRLDFGNSVK